MKIVRPAVIDDTTLISSNVVETAPAAYNSGTAYALSASASVTVGTVITAYRSLQAANTNHAPASSPGWWVAIGVTYVPYNVVMAYALDDYALDAAGHRVYQSAQGANTGHALTDPEWWIDRGPTNRWKMFDGGISTQSIGASTIEVTVKPAGRIDSVSLLNIEAATVRIIMTDAIDGVFYDQTFSMISDSGITDMYSWFYEPIVRNADLVLTDLFPYVSPTVQVIVDNGSSPAAVGMMIVGQQRIFGKTKADPSIGILDFSKKERDGFGNPIISQRGFARKGSYQIALESGVIDEFYRILGELRATPILYVMSDRYTSTTVYGFYREFSIPVPYETVTYGNLELEGLT